MIVDDNAREKAWRIWKIGQSEEQYAKMLGEMKEIEANYQSLLQTLSNDQQDIICDFVSQCEGMSWRMLEIAGALAEDLKQTKTPEP